MKHNYFSLAQEIDENVITDQYTSISEEEDPYEVEASDEKVRHKTQIDDDNDDEERNITNFLRFYVIYPDHDSKLLPAGIPIRSLVTLYHNSKYAPTLNFMYASLCHPKIASRSIQNFTSFKYDVEIKPGIETSFQYNFWPHHSFADRPFYLTIHAHFSLNNIDHQVIVYNSSHTFVDLKTSNLDLELLSIILIIVSLIAVASYFVYYRYLKEKFTTSKEPKVAKLLKIQALKRKHHKGWGFLD
ncbi:hypothetical protein HZS_6950 [Henneguya salminicola]|nr:hypothetical protein HZS_6950 [Henneguya salminicola]